MWPWIVAGVVAVLLVAGAVYLEFFSPRHSKRPGRQELGAGLNQEVLRGVSDSIRNQSTGL